MRARRSTAQSCRRVRSNCSIVASSHAAGQSSSRCRFASPRQVAAVVAPRERQPPCSRAGAHAGTRASGCLPPRSSTSVAVPAAEALAVPDASFRSSPVAGLSADGVAGRSLKYARAAASNAPGSEAGARPSNSTIAAASCLGSLSTWISGCVAPSIAAGQMPLATNAVSRIMAGSGSLPEYFWRNAAGRPQSPGQR